MVTEYFIQAVCSDCDTLHEGWRYERDGATVFEPMASYPGHPRCLFEASLLSGPPPEPIPLLDTPCDGCGEEGTLREILAREVVL